MFTALLITFLYEILAFVAVCCQLEVVLDKFSDEVPSFIQSLHGIYRMALPEQLSVSNLRPIQDGQRLNLLSAHASC